MKEHHHKKTDKESKKMMWYILHPEQRMNTYMDQKTNKYLNGIKKSINLKQTMTKWEMSNFQLEHQFSLFWNPACEGIAKIGKKKESWIVIVSIIVNDIQYDIMKHIFEQMPSVDDVLLANTLHEIDTYYRLNKRVSCITCCQCGKSFHWVEQEGTLQEKWLSFQEKFCGCE